MVQPVFSFKILQSSRVFSIFHIYEEKETTSGFSFIICSAKAFISLFIVASITFESTEATQNALTPDNKHQGARDAWIYFEFKQAIITFTFFTKIKYFTVFYHIFWINKTIIKQKCGEVEKMFFNFTTINSFTQFLQDTGNMRKHSLSF